MCLVAFHLLLGVCLIRGNTPAGQAMQIDQLLGFSHWFGLLGGCSGGRCRRLLKLKRSLALCLLRRHTVFVLKDKWDRAETHRAVSPGKLRRGSNGSTRAASQRATDQAVVADDLKKAYWKARKELDKTAASCASASVGEREECEL